MNQPLPRDSSFGQAAIQICMQAGTSSEVCVGGNGLCGDSSPLESCLP